MKRTFPSLVFGGDHPCHLCSDILLAWFLCSDPSGRDLLPGRDAPATNQCWCPAAAGVPAGRAARLESRRSCLPTQNVLWETTPVVQGVQRRRWTGGPAYCGEALRQSSEDCNVIEGATPWRHLRRWRLGAGEVVSWGGQTWTIILLVNSTQVSQSLRFFSLRWNSHPIPIGSMGLLYLPLYLPLKRIHHSCG